ncbi:hypothetical protein [Bacillus sp. FJAT-45350]|nr:hypothetical protein [Bacillus sp. FJAT-45350]
MEGTQYYVLLGVIVFIFLTFSLGAVEEEEEREIPAEVLPVILE